MRSFGGGMGWWDWGGGRVAPEVGPCPMSGGSPVFQAEHLPRVHSLGPWEAYPCRWLAQALELRGGLAALATPARADLGVGAGEAIVHGS